MPYVERIRIDKKKKWINWNCIKLTYLSRSSRLSTVPAKRRTEDKYTKLVVRIAHIVPIGMLFCASAKSPERFDPAIIPETPTTHAFWINVFFFYWTVSKCSRTWNICPKSIDHWIHQIALTGYGWEENTNQNSKCCGYIGVNLIVTIWW